MVIGVPEAQDVDIEQDLIGEHHPGKDEQGYSGKHAYRYDIAPPIGAA
jgi:hypothetical protein